MYLRKSVITLLLILCNVFVVVAQTTAESPCRVNTVIIWGKLNFHERKHLWTYSL